MMQKTGSMKILVLSIFVLVSIFYFSDVSAQDEFGNENIWVYTDKESYPHGKIVYITGKLTEVSAGNKVSLTVYSPFNSIIVTDKLVINDRGEFNTKLDTGILLMKYNGIYTIMIKYGENQPNGEPYTHKATTTFKLTSGAQIRYPEPRSEVNSLCEPGTFYDKLTNSCKLNYKDPPIDRSLQQENTQLKLENKQLEKQTKRMQLEIDDLQDLVNEQIRVILEILVNFRTER